MKKLCLIGLATLAMAGCGEDLSPRNEGENTVPAVAIDAKQAPPSRTEAYPEGTFVHSPDCAALPAAAAAICLRPVLVAGEANPDLSVETTRIDVDGDGAKDLLVRRRSKNDCGPGGCATFVLFARGGDFVLADPPINAEGPVESCRNDGVPGVIFPLAGDDASCIAVTPQQ